MKVILVSLFTLLLFFTEAQNVGIGTNSPNSSAALDVSSTNKGMLIPRLTTTQRNGISNPATGLMVFDTDKGSVMFYDGNSWRALSFSDESITQPESRVSSEPTTNAGFGSRVSMSGNYAIIGASKYSGSGLNNMGVAYIFNKTSGGWKQVARLAATDSAAGDYFGGSVAISGDYAVVGSPVKQVNSNLNQGKVYVYHRSGSSWLLDTALVQPGGQAYDYYGWSVGVCAFNTGGPAVAVGIPYSEAGGTDRGQVYFYRKSGVWSFVQNIIPADLLNSDYYGASISMDTDYVAIGAPGQDNTTYNITDAGAAYIYAYGGGVWNFQQKLSGTTKGGQFALALSLSSNMLAVGAPWAVTYTNTSSSVYLYSRTGSSWASSSYFFVYNFEIVPAAAQIQTTTGTAVSIADLTFGMSVSLSGKTLLIGASGGIDYPNGGASYYTDRGGTVYVYKNLSGTTFTRTNIIPSQASAFGDLFGQSVSISGNNYIIGGAHTIVNGATNAGTVYFGSE
jgi:FG-GAP repeat